MEGRDSRKVKREGQMPIIVTIWLAFFGAMKTYHPSELKPVHVVNEKGEEKIRFVVRRQHLDFETTP